MSLSVFVGCQYNRKERQALTIFVPVPLNVVSADASDVALLDYVDIELVAALFTIVIGRIRGEYKHSWSFNLYLYVHSSFL
jgi:hypothetical protein